MLRFGNEMKFGTHMQTAKSHAGGKMHDFMWSLRGRCQHTSEEGMQNWIIALQSESQI